MDDEDKFYKIQDKNNKENRRFFLIYGLISNTFFLICLIFEWTWWTNEIASIFLFFLLPLYVSLSSINLSPKTEAKLETWRDYYSSPNFVYHFPPPPTKNDGKLVIWGKTTDFAPLYDGDFVLLSNDKYMQVRIYFSSSGYNSCLELKDLDERNVYYCVKECADYNQLLTNLDRILKKKGETIIRIYNKYGDIRWQQSTNYIPHIKQREYLYKITIAFLYILYFVMLFMPLVYIVSFK